MDAAKPSRQKLFDQEEMASKLTQVFNKPFGSKDLPLKELNTAHRKGFLLSM
ncbi:MAG: hypothetical protein U5K69_16785 [Balneolaceae bacterium]|nr:hypothetical protein [Balneolaceae bacterium]